MSMTRRPRIVYKGLHDSPNETIGIQHKQCPSPKIKRSAALRFSTAHDFCVISTRQSGVRVQNVRDFPQTKLDSETTDAPGAFISPSSLV